MAVLSSLKYTFLSLALLSLPAVQAQTLNPEQDIILPSSSSASEPLKWVGANAPWYKGPDVNGVDNSVPDGCTVEMAAYVTRHGSRYPDTGAYGEWVTLYDKIQAANFKAKGSLEFIPDWKPVLKNTAVEIAQESITGYKEAFDMGYTLRTRYPDFYTAGQPFMAWANLYPRVTETAQNFVRGYMGKLATTLGTVYTIDSKAGSSVLGNSLAPSDQCPNFTDLNGGDYATTWDGIYLPPITKRLNKLLSGNLNLTDSDVSKIPYLCGFESQITGYLSPWCGVFTDIELKQYEYRQDLRYYYGVGPRTGLQQTMMLPFLNNLVGILAEGPGQTGKYANGTTYSLQDLLVAFANDGQINQLVAGTGVFDDQTALTGTKIPKDWKFIVSRFSSMRGTVSFERLKCTTKSSSGHYGRASKPTTTTDTYMRILLNDAVYPLPSCKSGPGKSCAMDEYVKYVEKKYQKAGNWIKNCNVTAAIAGGQTVVKGASFFKDLSLAGVAAVVP